MIARAGLTKVKPVALVNSAYSLPLFTEETQQSSE